MSPSLSIPTANVCKLVILDKYLMLFNLDLTRVFLSKKKKLHNDKILPSHILFFVLLRSGIYYLYFTKLNDCNKQFLSMNIEDRINAFSLLGDFLQQFPLNKKNDKLSKLNHQFYDLFWEELQQAEIRNRWFVKENSLQAIDAWAKVLTDDNLHLWISKYSFSPSAKRVGVVLAGNIPLVGFHDFLSVLISGNQFIGKMSSKDDRLPQFLSQLLIAIDARFETQIVWTDRLKNIDAIIATGSDNSARYFEYYFGKLPHIIRKNRSSWAILSGNESSDELFKLGKDLFNYYGLGCRNVSKLFVPNGYDFKTFFEAIEPYNYVYNNNKYANNYDYNQSVYLMNQISFLQNGFVILKEDIGLHSPLSVIFFEYYSNIKTVQERIKYHKTDIQCLCTSNTNIEDSIAFGETQSPNLWDYADNIDTLNFLSNL